MGEQEQRLQDTDECVLDASKPFLVLISGGPGTGKSTLAPLLADALAAVPISRDPIQEAIFDGWEPVHPAFEGPTRFGTVGENSYNEGKVSWDIFIEVVRRVLDRCAVVAESPFNQDVNRERFRRFLSQLTVPAVEVMLTGDPDVLLDRITRRAAELHAHAMKSHFTLPTGVNLVRETPRAVLTSMAPLIEVDTTSADVDIPDLARTVRALVADAQVAR